MVALRADQPRHGLARGQVGTVVEALAPGVSEVEFSDNAGRTYALVGVQAQQMIVLHYQPTLAAGGGSRRRVAPAPRTVGILVAAGR